MNIELKPIAESKVRQLGGDVCGVLVRNEAGALAAVDEHGRVQWLDDGQPSSEDHKSLVRRLDIALNGAEGAAQQASLCDIVAQVEKSARAQSVVTMGVGDGSGQMFVHGDHASIKACQAKLLQAEKDRARVVELERGGEVEPVADQCKYEKAQELWDLVYFDGTVTDVMEWLEKNTHPPAPAQGVPEGWRECLAEMVQAMHDYEMSVEEDAPYKHRAMMDRAHALLSTPTTPKADGCPECGSTDLSWHTRSSVTTGTPDGKLRANEVSTLFVLGCGHCSETIKTLTADQVAENMSPQPPAGQEGE